MSKDGEYLYCIIGKNEGKGFGYTGINNQELRLISYKDISAVVSSAPVINFDRLDKKELTRHIATHQKVNEEIMKDCDVVPVAFGIIAPSASEISRILEKVYLQFKTALKNITGKAEFAVQIWWDPKKILEELANTNPEIQKLKKDLSLMGKLISQKMEDKRRAFINDIRASLKNLSYDSTLNKLIDDEMIANFSFLIEKVKEFELDKKMQELGKKYDGKLRFKYIGPMPPYSFANINLGLGNFELINEARKLLGLGEEATFDEIKKAYYQLSHQYHPDKFQDDGTLMKKISQAYGILENYCQSCNEIMGNGQKYSFEEEDVKNSIMIKYV